MRGVGDLGAGHQHPHQDGGPDPRDGRGRDGRPRQAVASGSRRDPRAGDRDRRQDDAARDPDASRFRRKLSAALGEGPIDGPPSGAAALAALFQPAVAQGAADCDRAGLTAPGDAASTPPPPGSVASTPVAAARGGDGDVADAPGTAFAPAPVEPDAGPGGGRRGPSSAADQDVRLLAASDAAGSAGRFWSPFAPPAPSEQPASDAASADARVERVVAQIARAVEAEMAAGAVGPITVEVPVASHGVGLVGVSVTLTPDGIDVVLSRAAGAAAGGAALAEAARDLVSRLERRAPRGVVRVIEAVGVVDVVDATGDAPASATGDPNAARQASRPLAP